MQSKVWNIMCKQICTDSLCDGDKTLKWMTYCFECRAQVAALFLLFHTAVTGLDWTDSKTWDIYAACSQEHYFSLCYDKMKMLDWISPGMDAEETSMSSCSSSPGRLTFLLMAYLNMLPIASLMLSRRSLGWGRCDHVSINFKLYLFLPLLNFAFLHVVKSSPLFPGSLEHWAVLVL